MAEMWDSILENSSAVNRRRPFRHLLSPGELRLRRARFAKPSSDLVGGVCHGPKIGRAGRRYRLRNQQERPASLAKSASCAINQRLCSRRGRQGAMTDAEDLILRRLDGVARQLAEQERRLELIDAQVARAQDDVRLILERLSRLRLFLENKLR
jgi:hypothetical protein